MSLVFSHPGTSLFAFAGMEVGIEYSQIAAVLVEYLVCLYIRVIDWDVLALLERDAIQAVSQSEDTFDDIFQFEVGPEHLSIQIVFLHL